MPNPEHIAAWVLNSYPERGDGAFVVRGLPYVGPSLAGELLESLRSYFVAAPFRHTIMQCLQDMENPGGSITCENQDRAYRILQKDAAAFYTDMFIAHNNGASLFRGDDVDSYALVTAWLIEHCYPARIDQN